MTIIYLAVLWIILTAALSYFRRSAVLFLVWFALTAVLLWPVVRRAAPHVRTFVGIYSPVIQSVVDEVMFLENSW